MGVSALTRQLLATPAHTQGRLDPDKGGLAAVGLGSFRQTITSSWGPSLQHSTQTEDFLILWGPQGLSGQGGLTPTPKKTSKDQKERECMGPSNHHFLPDTFVKYYSQTGNTAILSTFKGNA